MPIKINNTYIIERFEDMPVKDLDIGRQIMLIQQHEDKESRMLVDKTTNMILDSIEMNMLYNFSVEFARPEIILDNDKLCKEMEEMGEDAVENLSEDEYLKLSLKHIDYITYESEYKNVNYIKMIRLGNMLYHMQIDENNYVAYNKGGYRSSQNAKEHSKHNAIYKRIFEWSANWRICSGVYTEQGIFTQYLSIPFQKNEVAMVFEISHDIQAEYRHWNINQNVYLIHKDGNVIELQVPMRYIYNIVKKNIELSDVYGFNDSEKHIEKFDKTLFAYEYDIKQFIKDKGQGLYEVKRLFIEDNMEIYDVLDKFYAPYFTIDGISVYPDTIRKYTHTPFLVKDGVEVGWRSDSKYPEHYRIGVEMISFYNRKGSGINPKNGMIENCANMSLEYGDEEGLIILVKDQYCQDRSFYIKKSGYFVKAKIPSDSVEISELKERCRLMEKLSVV